MSKNCLRRKSSLLLQNQIETLPKLVLAAFEHRSLQKNLERLQNLVWAEIQQYGFEN